MDYPIHFLNGKFVTEDQLLISPRDLGFTRGYAVFDFFRTYRGIPFKLRRNIKRLFNSASLIGLELPWTQEQVATWVEETLAKNDYEGEKIIKIILTGGISPKLLPAETPGIIILIDERHDDPRTWYEDGVDVVTVKFTRYTPEAKTNNYIEGVKQMQHAHRKGAIEMIYYNDEQVFEGATCNIFAIIEGKLVTPKTNILGGITRETLLEILKLDIPVEERDFTHEELMGASEVFLTSGSRGLVPVIRIDGEIVGDGKVGAYTREIMKQFKEYTSSDAWL